MTRDGARRVDASGQAVVLGSGVAIERFDDVDRTFKSTEDLPRPGARWLKLRQE